jgi:ADP-ribosylglycohydrolase
LDFTTEDVAKYWIKYLPVECTFTAERTTLVNLLNGFSVSKAKYSQKDEMDYIGAAIRIDGYAYVYPGNPDKAVELAYKDANLSHTEDGLFSALYFAALISMAFTSNDIVSSMEEALQYIPESSNFFQQVKWALEVKEEVINYQIANNYVTKRFPNMSWAHAINNACLTVWGIYIGRNDIEKGITETVAMGYDNDCTAATVGSVLGAYLGISRLHQKWYKSWNDKVLSYLNGINEFSLNDIINRYFSLGKENL